MSTMKVIILRKLNAETDTQLQGYLRDFEQRTGKQIELMDADSKEGVELAQVYDILQFPAILVREDTGELVQAWSEIDKWPTISELGYYTQ